MPSTVAISPDIFGKIDKITSKRADHTILETLRDFGRLAQFIFDVVQN
jgi:hypothetical protein